MKAEIIAVGTELLLGQVVNSNATFLSEELAGLGFEVYYHTVVGDNPERLETVLDLADSRSELVVLCGGLGPTEDDLTKQVVAKHVGKELIRDEAGYQKLQAFFAKREQPMTENNLLQALIIDGGQALANRTGLAVGIFYQAPSVNYLLLPGPPNELKPMVYEQAVPLLKKQFIQEEQLISRVLRFYGIGESRLVTELKELIEEQTNPTVAPYAKPNEVTLRLTVKCKTEAIGQQQLDELEQVIMNRVGEFFYGYGETNSLANVVVDLLKQQQKTITAAESLTAGLFQATLGDVPGVSAVFPGGFVTYSKEMKQALLGIDEELLHTYGTVSKECVEAMAQQARQRAQTDYAVAFSGVAGPEEIEGQEVGTVWIALASKERTYSIRKVIPRDRAAIRRNAVMDGLNIVRKALLKHGTL